MITLEEYYEQLINEIAIGADTNSTFTQSQFLEKSIEFLVEDGIIGFENQIIEFISADKNLRVDCFDYDENRNILNLIIVDFENSINLGSLDKSDINSNFKKVERFFKKSLKDDFYKSLEESNGSYEIAKFIFNEKNNINEINIILLTNKRLKTKLKKLDTSNIDGFIFNYDIWDIERFYNAEVSKNETESIKINFLNEFNTSIPALKVNFNDSIYSSYLCVISGDILAKMYEKYGSRLLEANIRSFLQFKSGINKGIRKTIKEAPEMFFAYNNGITATADGVGIDEKGNITTLKNLQIVNGGQTTASLYTSRKNDKSDLSKIFVQMKLSVIPENQIHEVVPNISRFANSQNKVSDSDLFSNHPFHRRMEEKSRRISTPRKQGELHQTKWYYERARGQYLEEQSKLTESQKRAFKELYPKNQLISKTDLAKVLVIFDCHPYKAVQGAQIVFKFFAENIVKEWDNSESTFNDAFFQFSIAKIIIFKTVQQIVSTKKDEIRGQDRAIVVAYTISSIFHLLSKQNMSVDFEMIWKKQSLHNDFLAQLNKTINFINKYMLEQTLKNGMTVLSFSKTIKCWQELQNQIVVDNDFFNEDFKQSLLDKSEIKVQLKESKINQAVESEVEIQKKLFKISLLNYNEMKVYGIDKNLLNENEIILLNIMIKALSSGKVVPNKFQIFQLKSLIEKLQENSFEVNF